MKIDPKTKQGDTRDGSDYLVDLELPDGRKCTILIPFGPGYIGITDGNTYGLNLVCKGHYT